MKTVRASSCGRADVCAQSTIPPKVRIDASDPTAAMGTAAHTCMAALINGKGAPLSWIAEDNDVDEDELRRLVGYGGQAWEELKTLFPDAKAEYYMEHEIDGVMFTGHADAKCSSLPRILEVKAGWKADPESHLGQLKMYCWLRLQEMLTCSEATGVFVFLRDRTWVKYTWSREELDQWARNLANKVINAETSPFSPGTHCQYCPREHECPAIQAQTRAGLALAEMSERGGPMVPADALLAYAAIQHAERVCRTARTSLRNHIATHGPIEADGQCLSLKTIRKREISAQFGWDVMASRLTIDELAKVVKVGIGDLVKAVRAKAGTSPRSPRGAKGMAERAFMDELDAAGALTVREQTQLELTTIEGQENDDDSEQPGRPID